MICGAAAATSDLISDSGITQGASWVPGVDIDWPRFRHGVDGVCLGLAEVVVVDEVNGQVASTSQSSS